MNIGVVGCGSIGSVLCSKLSFRNQLFAIVKPAYLARFQEYGINIQENTNLHTNPEVHPNSDSITFHTSFENVKEKMDIVLITVKSNDTENVAQLLKQSNALHDHSMVITLQNGIGNQHILSKFIPPKNVTQGVTYMGSRMERPGYVVFGGQGETILSNATDKHSQDILSSFTDSMNESGLRCKLVEKERMDSLIWTKLIINSVINPLASILDSPNEIIASDAESIQRIVEKLTAEGVDVARAKGIPLLFQEDAVQEVKSVAEKTGSNICSMLADLRRGRKTEIQVINQALVLAGKDVGVPTPINDTMVDLISCLEAKAS